MKSPQHTPVPDTESVNHEAWKAPANGAALLSQSDSPLVLEYVDTIRRKNHLEPERALMLAVLEQAINTFQANVFRKTRRQENQFREIEQWIWSENHRWLYSFNTICETLDISPTYLRAKLLAWQQVHLTSPENFNNQPRSDINWPKESSLTSIRSR